VGQGVCAAVWSSRDFGTWPVYSPKFRISSLRAQAAPAIWRMIRSNTPMKVAHAAQRHITGWPVALCITAREDLAGKEGNVGSRWAKSLQGVCVPCAWSLLLESPQWPGSADEGGERNRTEIPAIEGRGLVPVHEEDFALRDRSTSLPDRQGAAAPVVCERRAHLNAIDADGALVPA
jgi:hypothetical protein